MLWRAAVIGAAVGLVALIFVASSRDGDATPTSAKQEVSPSQDFLDVFDADVIGNPRALSLGIAGRGRGVNTRALTVRVYRRGRSTGWRRTPRLAEPLNPAGGLSLAQHRGNPCVGYEPETDGRVLACLRENAWRRLPRAGLPGPGARLAKIATFRGRVIAVFDVGHAPDTWTLILELRDGRWRSLGRPIPTHGAIATVGENSDKSDVLDVGMTDVATGRRTIRSFSAGRWRAMPPLEGIGAGPSPGGPVRLGARVYLPVVDASAEPWRFRVYALDGGAWSPVGHPLNEGPGNAQGVLRINAQAVWAAWQEHAPRRGGGFDTEMWVRRLTPTPGKVERVWAGTTIGPGDIETVQGVGGQSVMYMPQRHGRGTLTLRVEPVR